MTSPEPRNEKEMSQEREVNECSKQLELLSKYAQEKEITINEVEQTIKQLKNKKVGDHTGLRNEMLKAGGMILKKYSWKK